MFAFSVIHLVLLLNFTEIENKTKGQQLLEQIFKTVTVLNPSKNATDYWLAINKTILSFSKKIEFLWNIEKEAARQSISIAKEEALTFLAQEREKIMRMSHEEALKELIKVHKLESRVKKVSSISDNGLFNIV